MYGITMKVTHKERKVTLRALCKEDLPELVKHFSSMKIHMYTKGLFAQTLENEVEWYEKNRKDPDSCVWGIQPQGSDVVVGVTALHDLSGRNNSCSSGIIIWDSAWWGKGVASAAHMGRTMFAADYLNCFTIRSSVRVENEASRKALERMGYSIWGTEPVAVPRAGRWLDTHHLKWIHPNMVEFFFPAGLPEKYREGVEKAKIALGTARREVTFP
ncbi:TPA: hypothetical protein DIU27_01730 [Candidatus Collierbacteria bacterium]|uniref:GCN5-related N-acetyltransferase n=1 Tax=Candidatus Collierbacteria bacterium GW2011_GWB2_44_22 TaxID=1618387 RepID=A0A0G1HVS3_9BACT|nr:MAG: GCN5-related N-acetyltransferase [Candidatus Collierbacteria bacterium GW2011_GWA2_44_13]KKT51176.1 MAG: GCN5-related N-acetyltransferase [Candidatus Collierbacteria bacterium GW2011_GWB2_44_22]KKT61268.1 MAG: GCN5-related N-acetyltransferase [Candidatus Collierbacteria bacterium GW2011_GWD1_44_27]KKT65986.1 MAG: GCN5-related N-acetyltransferase [Candidatus Collierbacteria bacterium GW2011_GWC2_44_30]KKT68257.1 MAG: GCN5-related N-acetyltransferase [Microgenomates group bacterium GW2011